MRAIVIPANIYQGISIVENPGDDRLSWLQVLVGGLVEAIRPIDDCPLDHLMLIVKEAGTFTAEIDVLVNEEGRYSQEAGVNHRATQLVGYPMTREVCLVGDVVLVGFLSESGDWTSAPNQLFDLLWQERQLVSR